LTFDGTPSVTIPTGALVVSDPVELDVPDESDLAFRGPADLLHFSARRFYGKRRDAG
jgi:hypothetical protein